MVSSDALREIVGVTVKIKDMLINCHEIVELEAGGKSKKGHHKQLYEKCVKR